MKLQAPRRRKKRKVQLGRRKKGVNKAIPKDRSATYDIPHRTELVESIPIKICTCLPIEEPEGSHSKKGMNEFYL